MDSSHRYLMQHRSRSAGFVMQPIVIERRHCRV
jgi:hypothetical protein